jgi:hypothetical protein
MISGSWAWIGIRNWEKWIEMGTPVTMKYLRVLNWLQYYVKCVNWTLL